MPNRLAGESSPYLLQHADNPVDWYPWGEEALSRASAEGKPIFLSVGYAACHWCHVMAHESFEDVETATFMNERFVNVKVDREERTDLDQIYMKAVVAMSGHGGWPMSVWLTPNGVPFYGGTYFPPAPRHGMPSFKQVLSALADAWENRRETIERATSEFQERLALESALSPGPHGRPLSSAASEAVRVLQAGFDRANGGWGGAPKFPQPMTIEFLLRHHARTGDETARTMAERTLKAMAGGGIYDHLGGGFHRYTVDAIWLVPHFEKMLYDNAQLARVYLHAWQATGEPLYQRVVSETLDYVLREMTHSSGGFFSAQDADSEGEEGKFYVWSASEVTEALGANEAPAFCSAFGVSPSGNFEGKNILYAAKDVAEVAVGLGGGHGSIGESLNASRHRLLSFRAKRIPPARDEKVLTAWNGLMLAALAEAARALPSQAYKEAAIRNAEFILEELRTSEGRLRRSWTEATGSRLNAYLEDYTHLIDGLLELYQTTFEERWFVAARSLADTLLARFAATDGSFYDTSDDHEVLVVRPRDLQDNAVPSGNAMAATCLLRLAAYTADARYLQAAEAPLGLVQAAAQRFPNAFGQWLSALEFAVGDPREVAVLGAPGDAATNEMLQLLRTGFRPNQVIALAASGEGSAIPLLASRGAAATTPTAFVCRGHRCGLPATDVLALKEQLGEG